MFVSVQDLIILGIACISLIIWLGIFIAAKKYDELFEPLDEKEYALKELYSMGYFVMEKLKYNYKSRRDRKLRQDMEVLYEKKICGVLFEGYIFKGCNLWNVTFCTCIRSLWSFR